MTENERRNGEFLSIKERKRRVSLYLFLVLLIVLGLPLLTEDVPTILKNTPHYDSTISAADTEIAHYRQTITAAHHIIKSVTASAREWEQTATREAAVYAATQTPFSSTQEAAFAATSTVVADPDKLREAMADYPETIPNNAVQIQFQTDKADSELTEVVYGSGSVVLVEDFPSELHYQIAYIMTANHVLTDENYKIQTFDRILISQPHLNESGIIYPQEAAFAGDIESDIGIIAVKIPRMQFPFTGFSLTDSQNSVPKTIIGLGFKSSSNGQVTLPYKFSIDDYSILADGSIQLHNNDGTLFHGESGLVGFSADSPEETFEPFGIFTQVYPGATVFSPIDPQTVTTLVSRAREKMLGRYILKTHRPLHQLR